MGFDEYDFELERELREQREWEQKIAREKNQSRYRKSIFRYFKNVWIIILSKKRLTT
ncbi:hypothetical protein KFZ56_03545 [Virgibacillus sp. NKC19-3]|uniref:hypothetical protein n=1 Tax=Virgibacillus saliphilus TaxID=2831674 RepID=UPI001C9AFE99|nr:hypothetical protein [Virgibacillus sp. NKC19-3]MBY7142179.1 hypothetical protein [Virgibacillus sp. NKC19-3]